ncbi:hypothetical protein CV102_11430 [Natronococcus pandeyae]|uniref:Uncharacterized protein n=1 Tax=Natronococcus pandeyae TaxID=2055836 RepID=A0A8J8Q541_9EURY|nr:DUF5807 family protein [Natronococcus pandeyae]TYL38623.1 hypothetical protein CV102_11430 [Natronococcus pandeyae]
MSNPRAEFLAGERPDDVALFLADSYVSDERFEKFGDAVENGIVMIVDGESGRNAFKAATDTDAMGFAKTAMQQEGEITDDLTGGNCPDAGDEADSEEHEPQYIFAFAEEQNEDVGGIYAEGAVVHAYAQCTCGTSYSDRWNATDA